jgi:hypothetical protein
LAYALGKNIIEGESVGEELLYLKVIRKQREKRGLRTSITFKVIPQ